MSEDQLFIGIDSGTQGTKGVVFSREEGRIQADAYSDHQLIRKYRRAAGTGTRMVD